MSSIGNQLGGKPAWDEPEQTLEKARDVSYGQTKLGERGVQPAMLALTERLRFLIQEARHTSLRLDAVASAIVGHQPPPPESSEEVPAPINSLIDQYNFQTAELEQALDSIKVNVRRLENVTGAEPSTADQML